MHRHFITLLLFSWVHLGFAQSAAPEELPKLRVYVWDFSTQHMEEDAKKLADLLTNDFETELIQSEFYEVLEIRELSRLEDQRNLQRLIFNLNELSEEERNQLKDRQAEAVFFGKLIYNEHSKENTLEVKLQHLDGRLLRKGSIYLNPSELIMNETRRSKIHELFTEVHEDIFEAQRQALEETRTKQFELITEKLNRYMRRTDDLTTQFRRLDIDLLKVEGYVQEYAQCLSRYNELINDLLEKHTLYENNFKVVWGADLGDQLTRIFEQILDFHSRYIFKSLQKRNDLMIEFGKTKNKMESQKLKDDLDKEKRQFEETMNDQWPVVKSDVEQFLYHLRGQLNKLTLNK